MSMQTPLYEGIKDIKIQVFHEQFKFNFNLEDKLLFWFNFNSNNFPMCKKSHALEIIKMKISQKGLKNVFLFKIFTMAISGL